MLDRPDLSEEEYRKYVVPAFPELSQPIRIAGFHWIAFLLAAGGGWMMFLFLETVWLPLMTGGGVLLTIDYYLRKDPLWLVLGPRLSGTKRVNTPWYSDARPKKRSDYRLSRIVLKP